MILLIFSVGFTRKIIGFTKKFKIKVFDKWFHGDSLTMLRIPVSAIFVFARAKKKKK